MSTAVPAETGAAWEEKVLDGGMSLEVLPDRVQPPDGAQPTTFSYLPKAPRLAQSAAGDPVFSLTLILSRQPGPADETVFPLIQQGVMSLGLTLAIDPKDVESLRDGIYQPLFAREAVFSLVSAGSDVAGSTVSATGVNAHASLSAHLDRDQTLDVLSALDGATSSLEARCRVRYRAGSSQRTVYLQGSWASIYDVLAARFGRDSVITWEQLQSAMGGMIDDGVVRCRLDPPGATKLDPSTVFVQFILQASVILRRTTPDLGWRSPANRYTLRDRPDPAARLQLRETTTDVQEATHEISGSLDHVLGGALQGRDRSAFIHLVGPTDSDGGGLAPLPRRVRTSRMAMASSVALTGVRGGPLRSVPLALKPTAEPAPAAAVVASDTVRPTVAVGAALNYTTADLLIDPPDAGLRSLPVVEDPTGLVWHDRLNGAQYWYPPAFTVVQPSPTADPATSPFLFSFTQSGATASGAPGLDGTVRITLTSGLSPAAKAAAPQTAQDLRPLPLGSLSVSLNLPFRDETGVTKVHPLNASVTQAGNTLTVTIRLLDDWVKLCYGALAYANFQTQPARLVISYSYDAYVKLPPGGAGVVYGGKVAQIPVIDSATQLRSVQGAPYFDARDGTYQHPVGTVRFQPELPGAMGQGAPAAVPRMMSPMVARPELLADAALTLYVNRSHYGVQTMLRQETVDLLLPCDQNVPFYQLGADHGCVDALKLGQTTYKLYEEIKELKHSLYQVYRSLQQPGLFLVVPGTYRVTRCTSSDPTRAYRPTLLVYSTVDLKTPTNNQYVIEATLQPDIPPYARRELQAKLEAYANNPVIQFPTEVESTPDYAWTIGSGPICK